MRLPLLLLLASPALAPALSAQGYVSSDTYVQFGPGLASHLDSQGYTQDITFDNGLAGSLLLGHRIGWLGQRSVAVDLELEGYYADNKIGSDGLLQAGSSNLEDLTTTAVLVNAGIDWNWSDQIRMYLAGGVGYAPDITLSNQANGPSAPSGLPQTFELQDTSALAWQGKLGVRYLLGQDRNYSVNLGVRYFQTASLAVVDRNLAGGRFDLENTVVSFEIGFRWGI